MKSKYFFLFSISMVVLLLAFSLFLIPPVEESPGDSVTLLGYIPSYDLLEELLGYVEADNFHPRDGEDGCGSEDNIDSCGNLSKIFHVYGDREVTIEDSILLGVYAHDNSSVTIRNSKIYRAAEFDDASLESEDSDVFYLDDHSPELEDVLDGILSKDMTDRQKVMAIHGWVNTSINHYENTSVLPVKENFNATIVLHRMEGDCGAHSAIFTALAHFAGYPSRGIEASTHFVSEVFYDGKWHMIDSDPATRGRYFTDADGRVFNAYELSKNPDLYDKAYFHLWDSLLGRYYGMGIGQISLDGFHFFNSLREDNDETFRSIFYDNAWLYIKYRKEALDTYKEKIYEEEKQYYEDLNLLMDEDDFMEEEQQYYDNYSQYVIEKKKRGSN